MTAQAKPKTDELMDKILSCKDGLRKINKFERNRLISDAESLRGKIADFQLENIFGMIFCLSGDIRKSIDYHESALKKAPDDFTNKGNYFTSLNIAGFVSKGFEFGKLMLAEYPDDIALRTSVVDDALFLGRLKDAYQFLNGFTEPENHQFYEEITSFLPIFKKVELTDDEAEKIMSFAFSILNEKELFLSTIDANIVDDCLWIDFYVDFPEPVESVAKEIAKINWEADGILARNANNQWFDVIMFEFKSVEVLLEEREIIEKKERISGKW